MKLASRLWKNSSGQTIPFRVLLCTYAQLISPEGGSPDEPCSAAALLQA